MPLRRLASLLLVVALLPAANAHAGPAQWKSEGWSKTDFGKTKIKWDEVLSGGPPKDGIPSVDKPVFKPATEIKDLAPNEPVIGLDISGDARASRCGAEAGTGAARIVCRATTSQSIPSS